MLLDDWCIRLQQCLLILMLTALRVVFNGHSYVISLPGHTAADDLFFSTEASGSLTAE